MMWVFWAPLEWNGTFFAFEARALSDTGTSFFLILCFPVLAFETSSFNGFRE
jgi:hypothetical protein